MTWSERFNIMKKKLGLKNSDIANITGLNIESIKNVTGPTRKFSRWAKFAIIIFEQHNLRENKALLNYLKKPKESPKKEVKKEVKKVPTLKSKLLSRVEIKEVPKQDLKAYEIAVAFKELFDANLESLGLTSIKIKNAKYGNWVSPIRIMLKNGITIDQLKECFKFLKENDFWRDKIQSTEKLKQKFETIYPQIRQNEKRNSEKQTGTETVEQTRNKVLQGIYKDLQR